MTSLAPRDGLLSRQMDQCRFYTQMNFNDIKAYIYTINRKYILALKSIFSTPFWPKYSAYSNFKKSNDIKFDQYVEQNINI
jgi:hypothetical protein